MSEDTYMENDPKTLAEARTMLLDAWEAIDKGQQAERRRDELIVQAFNLGASYKDVISCTGLSRPTVWRIRRRAEKGIPSEEAGWDFTIPDHYSKTDVPQSILENTLQDGLIGLLDNVASNDSQLGKDISSTDLADEHKAIRDAIHDLATRAAVSKSDVVASTALGAGAGLPHGPIKQADRDRHGADVANRQEGPVYSGLPLPPQFHLSDRQAGQRRPRGRARHE